MYLKVLNTRRFLQILQVDKCWRLSMMLQSLITDGIIVHIPCTYHNYADIIIMHSLLYYFYYFTELLWSVGLTKLLAKHMFDWDVYKFSTVYRVVIVDRLCAAQVHRYAHRIMFLVHSSLAIDHFDVIIAPAININKIMVYLPFGDKTKSRLVHKPVCIILTFVQHEKWRQNIVILCNNLRSTSAANTTAYFSSAWWPI